MGVHRAARARVAMAGLQRALVGIAQHAVVRSCMHVQVQWACAAWQAGHPGEARFPGMNHVRAQARWEFRLRVCRSLDVAGA